MFESSGTRQRENSYWQNSIFSLSYDHFSPRYFFRFHHPAASSYSALRSLRCWRYHTIHRWNILFDFITAGGLLRRQAGAKNIQGIHKRMVRFQKLTRNLFLTLHGHNVHRQQRLLSKFLMRYQQFASHAYCGAKGPDSQIASQQEKTFCVLRFELSRSVITVQREFRARFRKDAWCVFSKPYTKLTPHCNHRSGHLKTEHTESLFLLRRHFGIWTFGPAVSMRSELLVAHEKLGQLPLLTVYVVPV